MRVRHLQTFLSDQKLLQSGNLQQLSGMRLGVDAIYWIRALSSLKDPLADAIGGMSPVAFSVLDSQISLFEEFKIKTTFVFQGMQPRSHMKFSSQLLSQIDEAWEHLAQGRRKEALQKFSQATSRNNSDFIWCIFHYLKSRNQEVFQSPYLATAQLASMVNNGLCEAVYGHPSLLLFGVPSVIVTLDFNSESFEWVSLSYLLETWKIKKSQFINACLLAGTEYCLTFPYLNLIQFHNGRTQFTFCTAIEFIKQANLINYMMHFPTEEMKRDHVDKYCICKSLILHTPTLEPDGCIKPLLNGEHYCSLADDPYENEANSVPRLPKDFKRIVGTPLPNRLYLLMAEGLISRKLPSVLALGEWVDYWHPTVDTIECRELISDVVPYRCKALGLLASKLHPHFRELPIAFSRYMCGVHNGEPMMLKIAMRPPNVTRGITWNFTASDVAEEMKRQSVSKVGMTFCINWLLHAEQWPPSRPLFFLPDTQQDGASNYPNCIDNLNTLFALVNFMLLEALEYFTETGAGTLFGSSMQLTPPEFEEDSIFALELMRFGVINGDPFEDQKEGAMKLFKRPDHSPNVQKSILLLSRVMSLVPMELKSDRLWEGDVDYDLAAFHSIVRILKNTLRHLVTASLVAVLLERWECLKFLPRNLMNPLNSMLPSFLLPRNCMGIIVKEFLEWPTTTSFRLDTSTTVSTAADDSLKSNTPTTITADTASGNNSALTTPDMPTNHRHSSESPFIPYTDKKESLSSIPLPQSKQPDHPLPSPLSEFEAYINAHYPCCENPLQDMIKAIRFWTEIQRIVRKLQESAGDVPIKANMEDANSFLWQKTKKMGLDKHPCWQDQCGSMPPLPPSSATN